MTIATSTGAVEKHVTKQDIAHLLAGEGGVDLEPVLENGKQVAMRIIGVAKNSRAARLGAQNGDTIESINDVALTSIEEAYRAGALVRGQKRIDVRGKRAGKPYETILLIEHKAS